MLPGMGDDNERMLLTLRTLRDERGVVTGWFVRVLLALAIAGVILFDAAALVINYFGLDSTADEMAVALVTHVDNLQPGQMVNCDARNAVGPPFCMTAHELANESEATLLEASRDAEGRITVRLRRTAETVLVRRLGFLRKYGVARAQGTAGT